MPNDTTEQQKQYRVNIFAETTHGSVSNSTIANTINMTLNKTNETTLLIESIELIQDSAEVGKPVKWYKTISVKNTKDVDVTHRVIDADIPTLSKNIIVREKTKNANGKSISASFVKSLKVKATSRSWNEPVIKSKAVKEYLVEYETPAPKMSLKKIPKKDLPKNTNFYETIRIDHDDENGTLHYSNVAARMPYLEKYDKLLKNGFIDFMWLGGTEKFFDEPTSIMNDPRFNVMFEDTNGNGIDDTIVFTVPKLSASDYGLAGYTCVEYDQQYSKSCAGQSSKECDYEFDPENDCLASGINCQMVNFTANFQYLDMGQAGDGYIAILDPQDSTAYYASYCSDVDNDCPTLIDDMVGPYWGCDYNYMYDSGYPNSCNLTGLGFNETNYTVRLHTGGKV
ncbi:MAG: hypothetical protein KAS12_01090, partial [Candidatus Aenigmarchaeota archaeon]|nr:hypothetical protein [Candidatus Aenigmarchaeota archaeon]